MSVVDIGIMLSVMEILIYIDNNHFHTFIDQKTNWRSVRGCPRQKPHPFKSQYNHWKLNTIIHMKSYNSYHFFFFLICVLLFIIMFPMVIKRETAVISRQWQRGGNGGWPLDDPGDQAHPPVHQWSQKTSRRSNDR